MSRSLFLAALYCGFLLCYGLTAGALYRTEGLRARVADEMLRGGDWLVPRLYGEPLLTKPPGAYAAIAAASAPFGGVREWTARLPSVLAAAAAVLLFFWTFARVLGGRAGILAALTLPASALWLDRVPSAEIDMLQLAWVSAALLCFLRALELAESGGRGACWWCAALLCVAGGVLTKWTAPAFFYLTAVPLLWWRGRLRLLLGRGHLLGLALAAGLCLAWAGVVAGRVGWETLRDTVTREALTHLCPGSRGAGYPWRAALLYPLRLLAAGLPWSAAALFALRPGFGRLWGEDARRLLQLLHCWAWPNLLFWALAPAHGARHALPLAPAVSGLAALVWLAWLTGRLRWPVPACAPRAALGCLLALGLAGKLVFVHAVVPVRESGREPREKGARLAALVPPGRTLYLFGAKDEGILFYYGRPARRLPNPGALPCRAGAVFCLVTGAEWGRGGFPGGAGVVAPLRDEQGGPLLLVRVLPK